MFGETQTGKSTLINAIARRWDRALIYEPKGEPQILLPNTRVARSGDEAARALPGRVQYTPALAGGRDVAREFDIPARRVLAMRGHAVVIHEGHDLSRGAEQIEPALGSLVYQGAGLEIPMLYAFQNPVRIWRKFFTSASIVIVFFLLSQAHRDMLAYELAVDGLREAVPRDYSFLVWRRDDPERIYRLPPLRDVA